MCLYPREIMVKRKGNDYKELVTVACGKCLECLSKYSTEWSFRIYLEAQLHKEVSFITLTYDNEHLPENGSLVRRDIQLFIKRLRKYVQPAKFRIFYCGEYGSKGGRPHFHLITFGYTPSDKVFFFNSDGHPVYKSAEVSEIWKNGFVSVEDVTLDSAKYASKYMQKLQKIPAGHIKPFTGMSNRPGIGYYALDLTWLDSDSIWINGKRINIPRYYLKVLEGAGFDFTDFHNKRIEKGELCSQNLEQRRKKAKVFLKSSKIFS